MARWIGRVSPSGEVLTEFVDFSVKIYSTVIVKSSDNKNRGI